MPCRYRSTADRRIPVEFVEADFEIGFSLIDLAESRQSDAARLLADAEDVYLDILARIKHLESAESSQCSNFQPLVGELRRAIDLAQLRHSGTA
jgi:hypothetical protein